MRGGRTSPDFFVATYNTVAPEAGLGACSIALILCSASSFVSPIPLESDDRPEPAEVVAADTTATGDGADRAGDTVIARDDLGGPDHDAASQPPVVPPEPPAADGEAEPEIAPIDTGVPAQAGSGRSLVSFLVSALVHAAAMICLALIVVAARSDSSLGTLTLSASVDNQPLQIEEMISIDPSDPHLRRHNALHSAPPAENPDVSPTYELSPGPQSPVPGDLHFPRPDEWTQRTDGPHGGLEGRNAKSRGRRTGTGATDASEAAVERGLWWLVAHQREDGSWSFDHREGFCQGRCRDHGRHTSTTAATALALAPFLGAGYTHQSGQHAETVRRGLYYLQSRAFVTDDGCDLREGTMYAQGLAAIVLCEAYAMTGDDGLFDVAQGALDYIEYAQDKNGGGWRYNPHQPGDTTVTGWQLMGLKSGQMARLRVRSSTMLLVNHFLDSVQSEEGARYGYQDPTPGDATTAIGLLCRMYLGWPREHPPLAAGVAYLDRLGPSEDDMYYNYYATQVLHHWQGSEWKRWNDSMRDYLVSTQADRGHMAGSWYFDHEHSTAGGRLYNTAMAVMILEVYYRYMPLYGESWSGK